MPLKRFNYKISRQISCPYGGCLLISQWNWVKQLSLDTVYLFSKETWGGIDVMRRFKLRYTLCPYSLKRVVRQTKAWKEIQRGEQHGERMIINPRQNNTFISGFWKLMSIKWQLEWKRDVRFTRTLSLSWKKIWLKGGKIICGFHWVPEGLE